jgi:hypothetical protein
MIDIPAVAVQLRRHPPVAVAGELQHDAFDGRPQRCVRLGQAKGGGVVAVVRPPVDAQHGTGPFQGQRPDRVAHRFVIPGARRAARGRLATAEQRYAATTRQLVGRLSPAVARALLEAWSGSTTAAAADAVRVLRAELLRADPDLSSVPVADLLGNPRETPNEHLRQLVALGGAVCGPDPGAWTALLRLAPGFAGTVSELMATTAAVLAAPATSAAADPGQAAAARPAPPT